MNHPAKTLRSRLALGLAVALLAACGGGGGGVDGGGGGGEEPPIPPGPDVTPPTISLGAPGGPVAVIPGDGFTLVFKADDDRSAEVRAVLDADGDFGTAQDQIVLYTGTDQNGVEVVVEADTSLAGLGWSTLFVSIDDGTHPVETAGGVPILVYAGLAGVSAPRSNRYGITGTHVVFSVGEVENGAGDLNADGDVGDGVVHVLDTTTGTVDVTGLTVDVSTTGLVPTAQVLSAQFDGILWHRREADEGTDLNADGDMLDTVVSYTAPLLGVTPTTHAVGGALVTQGGGAGRCMIRLTEASHGRDLNGDGDMQDELMRALDLATNTLLGVGPEMRPGTPYVSRGDLGIFLCDEGSQGAFAAGADLNGDFDTADTLVALVDSTNGNTVWVNKSNVSPTAAIDAPARTPVAPIAGYYVDESLASPGASLNGDVDTIDFVPTLAGGAEVFPTLAPLDGGSNARYVFSSQSIVIHLARELPGFDLNGDGDVVDQETMHWINVAGTSPWAPLGFTAEPAYNLTLDGGFGGFVAPDWLGLAVTETANGRTFNGDGDLSDTVFFLVDMSGAAPAIHNTGIVPASPATLPLPGSTIPVTGVGGDSGVVILAAETANGDLNNDGDTIDTLLVYFDFSDPTTPVVLPDTGALHASIHHGVIATTTYEALASTDLNGDGDATDFLFRCFDLTGAVIEPGRPCDQNSVPAAAPDGEFWVYLRSESAEQRILNEDADMTDVVMGLWYR